MRATRFWAFFAGVLLVGAAAPLRAQSLGDVAKKEEERRKQQPSSGKVYTNKDLGAPLPGTGTVTPASTPASSEAGEADKAKDSAQAAEVKKDDKGEVKDKDKTYWAGRHKSLQDALDRNSTYLDALQSRINSLATDFVNRDDPAQRAKIEQDRQKALAELDRLKKQIQQDRKAIADLEEEARRAGVPPGWLR